VHSVEMQIHAYSKGKVALDDITLWANFSTKRHGNTISRFHWIAYYVSGPVGVNSSQGIIFLRHPPNSSIIFDPQAITAGTTFVHKVELCSRIHSTNMKG